MKIWNDARCTVAIIGLAAASPVLIAQAAPAAPANRTCKVEHWVPTDASRALQKRDYTEAERIYTAELAANPESSTAKAGLVHARLAAGKSAEALGLAVQYDKAHPNDPVLLDALGEVRFRRGEVEEAAINFNHAMQLDTCNATTHYDFGRYLDLAGMHAKAQKRLDAAHSLSPDTPSIKFQWMASHATPATAEERLARLKTRLAEASLTDDQKQGIEAAIKGIETREKGTCELVQPITEVKLPIVPIAGGPGGPEVMYAAGLDIQFNGHRERLEIDTGASGLMLSRSAAKQAGLVPELEIKTGGIGDNGLANAFVTHVDDIKIGGMEFKNCMVRVLESRSALSVDGLIGPDVFRDYLVTLDIPSRVVKIGPLPKRPDEDPAKATALATGDDDAVPLSRADRARDRYIAPEMKTWTPVFRSGHNLIFPTSIGNAPTKLFIMDTGASRTMISPVAAREVTHVAGNDNLHIKGISGEVNQVFQAENVTLSFGGVRQITREMASIDTSNISRSIGIEIAGLIGFPTLREVIITIDYRDDLVNIHFDPTKGFHGR